MVDDHHTDDMEENGDEHSKEEGLAQTWKFRSGEAWDSAALAVNQSRGPESESNSVGLFALFAQDDAVKPAVYDVPSVPSSIPTPAPSSTSEDTGRLSRSSSLHEMLECHTRSNRPISYQGPRMPQGTDAADLVRAGSTSTLSSASGDALANSHLETGSAPESPDARPPVGRGLLTEIASSITHPEPSRPTSVPIALSRRDGAGYPSYPNQSFSALQSQSYTLYYPSRPLRARNSHSSQNSLNTSGTGDSRYAPTMASGARTVGSTPIHSPHLFTPTVSRNRASGDESEDSHYNTPLLHHTHLQAPIETNKLQKDFDPVSGRKIVNNYEFLRKLGSGAHGTVKLGKNIDTGELVAIKIVRRFSKKVRFGKPPQNPDDMTKKEVAILKKARHPHVVSLLEVIDDDKWGKVYLVLEYVELGEIVWRKQADKDIARFEMGRVSREKSGHVDDDFEIAEIEKFNATKLLGREGKARLPHGPDRELDANKLLNRPRLHVRTSEEPQPDPDGGSTSFWSLEYANDSEEDHPSAFRPLPSTASRGSDNMSVGYEASQRSSTASLECSTPAQSDTPRPSHSNVHDIGSLRTASNVSARSRPTSLSRPPGDMFLPDPQTYRSIEKAPDLSTLERTANPTAWSSEEEEFMHVPCLTISQALDAFRDTMLGLEYLHYQGIIHRDIKPANLLWTSARRVKISDFGVSYLGKPIRENEINDEIAEADEEDIDEARELAKTVGTPAFYAPELCDPGLFDSAKRTDRPQITGQIDVWALGVTLYGMIFGRLPFFGVTAYAMYEKIATQEVFIPRMRLRAVEDALNEASNSNKRPDDILEYEEVDEELRDLLEKLLEKQPSKRISLKEVKEHPWVVRGISDISAWMDQTDPSVQSQGKKIEVSNQEVQEAVVGLRFVELIRTGMKGIRSIVRGRDSRKRGHSNAKTSDSHASTSPSTSKAGSTTSSYEERRRSSLRGDEQIYSALRASREGSEHPLSQSVAASPEVKQSDSYFDLGNLLTVSHDPTGGDPSATRPNYLERTLSNAESTKTIRPPIPASMQEIASATAEPFSAVTPSTDLSLSSGLGGIFGGAGRRFVRGMRSRERGRGRDSPSLSSNSSSVAVGAAEDPHGLPSVAITATVVTGHVDQPPVLQDPITPTDISDYDHGSSSESHAHIPHDSYFDPFHHSRSGDYYSRVSSGRSLSSINNRRHTVSSVADVALSPSSDDRSYPVEVAKATTQVEDLSFPVSSSSEQITSGMSESTSYPSIPSVISGASLLSAHADDCHPPPPPIFAGSSKTASQDSLSGEVDQPTVKAINRRAAMQARMTTDDDEAGYNGGGEQDSDSDDGGIEMSGRRPK